MAIIDEGYETNPERESFDVFKKRITEEANKHWENAIIAFEGVNDDSLTPEGLLAILEPWSLVKSEIEIEINKYFNPENLDLSQINLSLENDPEAFITYINLICPGIGMIDRISYTAEKYNKLMNQEGNTSPDDRKRSILAKVFENLNKQGFSVNSSTIDKMVQDDHKDYLELRQKSFLNILKEALDSQLGQLVEFSVKYASYLNTQLDRDWEMIYASDHITITDLLNLKLSKEEL